MTLFVLVCAAWACGDDPDDQPAAASVERVTVSGHGPLPLAGAALTGLVLGAGLVVWRGRAA